MLDSPDVLVRNHRSIFLLWPQSWDGARWLRERTFQGAQWWGSRRGGLTRGALVVEPRYVADIVAGARDAGLRVA
jgi:hypothetical protein